MAAIDRIIPRPLRCAAAPGEFIIDRQTSVITNDPATTAAATLLVELTAPALGYALPITGSEASAVPCIRLRVDPTMKGDAYRLQIAPDGVEAVAGGVGGLICAVQTIRQLLPATIESKGVLSGVRWTLPCGTIEDQPRFMWRGMMLDCARHFMPIPFVLKFIDLLSLYKFNVFHWHLTEDQGWRIEIKKYPRLTDVGAWRADTLIGHALPFREASEYRYDAERHGGFYTQAEIRAVVAYAARRNVTVVPEIEMPGHSQAAIAAYPQLGNLDAPLQVWNHWGISKHILNVDDATLDFMKDVLHETMDLFPSTFIHVGGDEAPKDEWKAGPRAQARMRELGLADEHELQSWFIRQMDAFLTGHGRRLIGWDEILEGGLAPGAAVMSWRGEAGGIAAARAGHDVVMAPQGRVYFDHYQTADTTGEPLAIGGHNPLEKVYGYDPVPADFTPDQAARVLGAQAQLWTEYMPTPRDVERMAFPRACAMAEVVWSTSSPAGDFDDFKRRLRLQTARLRQLDVHYHRSLDAM